MKPLNELIDTEEPAWPTVREWAEEATHPVEVLPAGDRRDEALVELQVTTRSTMGAITYESGGLLVDHGWLRILGSGSERLPRSIAAWTKEAWGTPEFPGNLLIADDVVGGSFALDGGAFGEGRGGVFYFAPDELAWVDLELGYSQFVGWALQGDLASFYEDFRWPGWEQDVKEVRGDQALSIQPFLWSEGPPIGERDRRPVPVVEAFGLQQDLARQLGEG